MPEADHKRLYAGMILLIVAAGTALRFYKLDLQSFWFDELYSATSASSPSFKAMNEDWISVSSVKYFYHYLLFFWFKMTGSSAYAARWLAALTGSLALVVFSRNVCKRYGMQHGVVATALLTCSFGAFYYSQEARFYSFFLLASCQQMFYWLDINKSIHQKKIPSTALLFKYCLLGSLIVYIHHFGLFLTFYMGVYHFFLCFKWKKYFKTFFFTCIAIFIIITPDLYKSVTDYSTQIESGGWIPFTSRIDIIKSYIFLIFFHGWPMKLWAVFLLACPLLRGVESTKLYMKNLLFSKNDQPFTACIFLCLAILLTGLALTISTPMMNSRYLLHTVPLAVFASTLWILHDKHYIRTKIICTLLFCGLGVFSYFEWHFKPRKVQWREATAYCIDKLDREGYVIMQEIPERHRWLFSTCFKWQDADHMKLYYISEIDGKIASEIFAKKQFCTINLSEKKFPASKFKKRPKLIQEMDYIGKNVKWWAWPSDE